MSYILKNNFPNFLIDGKTVHSAQNPEKESARLVATISQDKQDIVFFGIGAGYHVFAFLEKICATSAIKIHCHEPLQKIRETPEFQKIKKEINARAKECATGVDWDSLPDKNFSVFFHPFYTRNFPELCQAFTKKLQPETNKKTREHFSRTWLMNYARNLQLMQKKTIYSLASLKNSWHGKTVVFTGAAPSLEDDIDWIQNNRSNMVLVASDTSLGFLLANNISPDYILSIDAGRGTGFHFPASLPANIPFLSWTGANSRIFELANPVILLFTTYPLDQYAAQVYGEDILENPSLNIAGMAKSVAEYMEGYLLLSGVGLRREKGKSHCRGTGYSSYMTPLVNRKNTLEGYQPGYYQASPNQEDRKTMELLLSAKSRLLDKNKSVLQGGKTASAKHLETNSKFIATLIPESSREIFLRESGFEKKLFSRFLTRLQFIEQKSL